MIRLNLKYLLQKENKTRYWLMKQLNSNYTTVNKLVENETTKITFDMIERLLKVFDCKIEDLLINDEENKDE